MVLLNVLRFILNHPLNRHHKFAALLRFGRWQIGSRFLHFPVAIDFVNDSRLLISQGMTSATGNLYCGLYDFEEMSFLLHLLRPEDTFIDVGANVGSYVVLAGAAIGCFCHAIEPDPESFERLLDNIFLNRIPDRVKAHNIGSASENGILRFLSGLDTINHVISDESPERQYIQVVVKKLDDIVGEDKPIALKIDVEGFETSVIMGSQALLEQETLWAVVMEQNGLGERYGFDEEALHQRMVGEYGFQPVRYDPVKRDLLPKEKNDPYQNQIYVRERSKVLSRLKSAQKYSVFGRAV